MSRAAASLYCESYFKKLKLKLALEVEVFISLLKAGFL